MIGQEVVEDLLRIGSDLVQEVRGMDVGRAEVGNLLLRFLQVGSIRLADLPAGPSVGQIG